MVVGSDCLNKMEIARFEVYTAVWLEIKDFWDVIPCRQLPTFLRSVVPLKRH
jgi:hypothetical protein